MRVLIPVQTCVSARPPQQTALPRSRLSDPACNEQPPHLTGPIETYPAPEGTNVTDNTNVNHCLTVAPSNSEIQGCNFSSRSFSHFRSVT